MSLHGILSRTQPHPLTQRQKRIHTFLQKQHIGVLSTVTPDHDPHGAVIYYALGDDFTIWFITKKGTHKYDNMIRNNHVMFTVFEARSQTTSQVLGTAIEYSDAETINKVSNEIFKRMIHSHDNQLPPIVKLQAGGFTAFAIKPVQIRIASYAKPDPGDHDQLFESIESFELVDN